MQPVSHFIPGVLAQIVRQAPLSAGKVEFAWRTAVGPALARTSGVRLEGGVLLVDAQTPQWAAAITGSSRIILTRMQALLGDEQVRAIQVRR